MNATPHALATQAADSLRARLGIDRVDVGLILGSGWNAAAQTLGDLIAECPLEEIPGFRKPVVAGHGGQVRAVRTRRGKIALVFTGRTHYYEGLGVDAVVHWVRTTAALGGSTAVLTNGCGGVVPTWGPGTIVALRDHINLTAATPLHGATFIDMTDAYSPALRQIAAAAYEPTDAQPSLYEGVYAQFSGPQYETPAEVRMAAIMGADLVGMSTALETIAAREAGLDVLALSLVTNHAAGVTGEALDHSEVIAAGKAASQRLAELLTRIVDSL